MSIKFRHKPHKFSFAYPSYFLRCERLEDRLAFSTSNALSCLEIAASPVTDPPGSETTSTVKIGIVEDQETTPLPCDLENPVDFEPDLEYDDQQLVEDDQIVWYMPWFGDESDGAGELFYDDAEGFAGTLPGKFDWDTPCNVWYSPIYYFCRLADDNETGALFSQPVSEDFLYATDSLMMDCVALWDSGVVEVPSSGTVESFDISVWSTAIIGGTAGANLPLAYSYRELTLAGNILQAPPPATMSPFGFALAPDSGGLQLYWPSGISTSDKSEKKDSPVPLEAM